MIKKLFPHMGIELHKWAMSIALIATLIHFSIVTFIVISRINYRYDLEWMEGASLIEVYRIFFGQNLYVQPSLNYIPSIYPPLYFYLSAALAKIIGIGFLPLRIISITSSIGCLLVIFQAVKEKTQSIFCGFIAAGGFVAIFRLGGAWFDIARIDMLFIFLCLAGTYTLAKQTTKASIIAGIFFSLALLTKQTAISIFGVLVITTLILFKKQTIPFICSFTFLTLVIYYYLNSSSNGWYQYYTLILPTSYQIRWSSLFATIQAAFLVEAVFIIIGILPLILDYRKVIQDKLLLYYYSASIGFAGTAVIARINHGAYDNTLLPAYAIIAIIFGLGVGWLILYFEFQNINNSLFQTIMWLAITIQFFLLGYNPIQQIPTLADRRAGDKLVSQISSVPGNVLIPYHNYLNLYAGKNIYFHFVAFNDIRSLRTKTKPELRNILQQFHSTPFSLLIMDLPDNLIQNNGCANTENINYESNTTFIPVTGYSVRPTIEYIDCP
jgi:4-amino-4-deoxy-L-arabinose transferase-like glycosyltransferase